MQEGGAAMCGVTLSGLTATVPGPVKLHSAKLRSESARSRHFGELEHVYRCPFHEHQRLADVAVTEDGDVFGMAVRPLQLFNFSVRVLGAHLAPPAPPSTPNFFW